MGFGRSSATVWHLNLFFSRSASFSAGKLWSTSIRQLPDRKVNFLCSLIPCSCYRWREGPSTSCGFLIIWQALEFSMLTQPGDRKYRRVLNLQSAKLMRFDKAIFESRKSLNGLLSWSEMLCSAFKIDFCEQGDLNDIRCSGSGTTGLSIRFSKLSKGPLSAWFLFIPDKYHQDRKDTQQSLKSSKGARRGFDCSWRSKTGHRWHWCSGCLFTRQDSTIGLNRTEGGHYCRE